MEYRCRLDYVVFNFSFVSLFSGKEDTVMIVLNDVKEEKEEGEEKEEEEEEEEEEKGSALMYRMT